MSVAARTEGGGQGEARPRRATPAQVVRLAVADGLPAELGDLVLDVVMATRLWNGERTDVARELCAHFADGVRAGLAPGDLKDNFGDPRRAARLISRAKRRNRPAVWRVMRRSVHVAGALVLAALLWYGWNAARFYSGTPSLRINLQAEMNARALEVPLADRGWPHYRDAYRALTRAGAAQSLAEVPEWPWIEPGTPQWERACALADTHRASIQAIYAGASKRCSAYVMSADMPMEADQDPSLRRYVPDGVSADGSQNPLGIGILLPNLAVLRHHARWVAFDAFRAAHAGDGQGVAHAVGALVSMASHAAEDRTLISQLVALAIGQMAGEVAGRIVMEFPSSVNDRQLVEIIHTLGAHAPCAGGRWTVDMTIERRMFDDLLQRFFTDDGDGDGRLCKGLMAYDSEMGIVPAAGTKWAAPALRGVVAGRKAHRERFNAIMDRYESLAAVPLYRRDYTELDLELSRLRSLSNIRYSLVPLMVPALQRSQSQFDVARAHRDGVVAGLCIELHRRRSGRYAQSWDELVPTYLPAAPQDPWSGRAMGLASTPGQRPLVYSVGIDQRDDNGTVGAPWRPSAASNQHTVLVPSDLPDGGGHAQTLDWVIWPRVQPSHAPARGPVHRQPPVAPARREQPAFEWGWVGSLTSGGT